MKKLTCHCKGVEAEVKLPEKGFEKLVRCNCSICKRKGYIMTPVSPENFKLTKQYSSAKVVLTSSSSSIWSKSGLWSH